MISLGLQRMQDAAVSPEKDGSSLHERDFFAWTQDQAGKLRARAAVDDRGDIDWTNAAEEIESVVISEKREIRSRLEILLIHLLKWRFQVERRKYGWDDTIREQRKRLLIVVRDSPSLRVFPAAVLDETYELAVIEAARETGLAQGAFPETCPFTIEDILDPAFLPAGA